MCTVSDIMVQGESFNEHGIPTRYVVSWRAFDCDRFQVTVRVGDSTGSVAFDAVVAQPVASRSSLNPGPPDYYTWQIGFAFNAPDAARSDLECNDRVWARVTCADVAGCSATTAADDRVACKAEPAPAVCPSGAHLGAFEQDGTAVAQVESCLPATDYEIRVLEPLGSEFTYYWSIDDADPPPPNDTINDGATRSFTYSLPPDGAFHIITVIVTRTGCIPRTGTVVLQSPPAGSTCPTSVTLSVTQGGTVFTDPAALPPGTSTVRVTTPTGAGLAYTWSLDGAVQPGESGNSLNVLLPPGATVSVGVAVNGGECCAPVPASIVLHATGTGTLIDTGTTTDNPPVVVVDPPPTQPACPVGRALAAIVLAATLVLVVLFPCLGSPALAAAIVAGLLLFGVLIALLLLLCSLTRCEFLGIVLWALKWGAIVGLVVTASMFCIPGALIALGLGALAGLLTGTMRGMACPIPRALGSPP